MPKPNNDGEFITATLAARMLGVHPNTLREHETPDGRHCLIHGGALTVWRTRPGGIRQYSRTEIKRLLRRP